MFMGHGSGSVGHTEIHPTLPQVYELNSLKVETALEILKRYKISAID
jgi:hypothetical protein